MKPLNVGEDIRIQNPVSKRFDTFRRIVKVGKRRRYYIRREENGKIIARNRKFLRVWRGENLDDEPNED